MEVRKFVANFYTNYFDGNTFNNNNDLKPQESSALFLFWYLIRLCSLKIYIWTLHMVKRSIPNIY